MTKNSRLAAIVKERGLLTTGFRQAMLALANEFIDYDEDDPDNEGYLREDCAEMLFDEWLGEEKVRPAAYRIVRGERPGIYGVTVEVYEIEGSVEIPEWRLAYWGNFADGEGPQCDLHILDRYDHEIVVKCEDLMRFMSLPYWSKEDKQDELKWLRSRAVVQHHAPVTIDYGATQSKVTALLQDVIYGLGLGHSHNVIAARNGLDPNIVKSTAQLLVAKDINPKEIVKDTHARWKAAYDAVRELGVQL